MRNRMVQKSMFSEYRAVALSPSAKWLLVGLMVAADDVGNVGIDSKWLKNNVHVKAGQTIDDLNQWIEELTDSEFIATYEVDGMKYASITEWDKRDGLTFQSIKKVQGWRNPTPAMEREPATKPKKKVAKKPAAKRIVKKRSQKLPTARKVPSPSPTKGQVGLKTQKAAQGDYKGLGDDHIRDAGKEIQDILKSRSKMKSKLELLKGQKVA